MGEVDFSAYAELLLIGLCQLGADFAVLGKLRRRCGSLFAVPCRPALKGGAGAATQKRHRGKQQQTPVHRSSSNASAPSAQLQSVSGWTCAAFSRAQSVLCLGTAGGSNLAPPWRNATANTAHDPACHSGTRRT